MSQNFTMFVVDDAQSACILLESAFGKEFRVESFATAEDCLERLTQDDCRPDIFLLDVDLPGIDGYTLCRRIKERQSLKNTPTIFISNLDDLESRLEGYDAGGIDYVVKPYNLDELRQKVGAVNRLSIERKSLRDKALESELLSSLVLSNMDQYAALITFLRSLNNCETPHALVESLFPLMRSYRLQTAIQIRLPGLEMTVNESGGSQPLEVAVINNMRSMEHIFEFKSRAAYNFEHITILVNNVPLHDPDLCGILRDNVAIAAECADAKLQTLQTKSENTVVKGGAADLLSALQTTVRDFSMDYATARHRGSSTTLTVLGELSQAFSSLGMSFEQEESIDKIVQSLADDLAEIYDFSGKTQQALNEIAEQLSSILNAATVAVDHGKNVQLAATRQAGAVVELF